MPKCDDASVVTKFRPISLMIDGLKMITKGVDNRLSEFTDELIDKTQTAFMKISPYYMKIGPYWKVCSFGMTFYMRSK
jgi:hypothetical protein